MNLSNTVSFKYDKFVFHITYTRRGGLPRHKFIKKSGITKRSPQRYYFDERDDLIKEIVYPEELWYKDVFPDDPVEKYIHTAIEYIPEWTKIVVECADGL
jgi:hypothetical protein